jgi:hypothetical protein
MADVSPRPSLLTAPETSTPQPPPDHAAINATACIPRTAAMGRSRRRPRPAHRSEGRTPALPLRHDVGPCAGEPQRLRDGQRSSGLWFHPCDVQARRQRDCRERHDRADKVEWLLYHGHGRQVPHPPVVHQLPVTAIGRASGRAAVATAATEPGMTTENHSTSDATDNRPRPPQATFSSRQFTRLTQRRGPKASTSAFGPERPSSVRAQRGVTPPPDPSCNDRH